MPQLASESSLKIYRFLTSVRPAPIGAILKRLLHIKRSVVETEKGKFYLDPASNLGLTILEEGTYEPEMIKALEFHLKPGDVCFDVGANEGYHSVIASKIVGATGRVFAIEPQKRVLSILKENLQMNLCRNVRIIEVAISNEVGEATLHLSPDVNTGPSSLEHGYKYRVPTQSVQTMPLKRVFDDYGIRECHFMKMDIEGFEHEAIFGSPELFKNQMIRTLAVEPTDRLLKQRGHSAENIATFLSECGYQLDTRFINDLYRQVWTCVIL